MKAPDPKENQSAGILECIGFMVRIAYARILVLSSGLGVNHSTSTIPFPVTFESNTLFPSDLPSCEKWEHRVVVKMKCD